MGLWKGRAAEVKKGQNRAERVYRRRVQQEVDQYVPANPDVLARDADAQLRTARSFRWGGRSR